MRTRGALVLFALVVLASSFALPAAAEDSPGPSPTDEPARPKVVRTVFGHSVRDRPIRLVRVGPFDAPHRVLVVGCIHGDECDGTPILQRLREAGPPAGTAYYLVPTLNPDGRHRGTRQNVRGVDLNRNFPYRWKANGPRGGTYYPGPRARSERETRAAMRLIERIRPTVTVWYHQHLNVVDHCSGKRSIARRYAEVARMRLTTLTRYPGSAATWQHHHRPRRAVLVVELPSHVTPAKVKRHARAVEAIALR